MESGECFTPQLQEHRGKLRINTALITPQNGVNQKRSCSYTLFKKWIRHFYWPSRGGTKQLKADTVVLAKTWQEAPHRAAEMFPGENPAPNTCTSLPPRQPLKTKWQVHDSRGKSLFLYSKLKPMLPCCLLFFFFLIPSRVHTVGLGSWFPQFLFTHLWSLETLFCQIPIIFNNLLKM